MFSKYLPLLLAVVVGCVTPHSDTNWPEPSPLVKDTRSYHAPKSPDDREVGHLEVSSDGALTLRRALVLALMKNAELASFSWQVRAAEARILQAGMRANPELAVEVEDFAGQDEREGFDGVEVTVQLSQLIELGGKASRRARVASLERDLSAWDYESKRLEVFSGVVKAFVEVLAAQERVVFAGKLCDLAGKLREAVAIRVQSGKVSPIEETRANVAFSTAQIQREQAVSSLAIAKGRLAVFWGEQTPAFTEVRGNFYSLASIPDAKVLAQKLLQNPDLARWQREIEKRKATIVLEEAQKIPDVTVDAGIRFFNETDDQALVAGFSLPLPLINRNEGNILAARYQLSQAMKQREAEQSRVATDFYGAYQSLQAALREVKILQKEILPNAEDVFNSITEGYREGKFDYLQVLDAQRTLFEAQLQYLDALASYHKGVVEVERLIADRITDSNAEGDHDEN